MMTGPGTNTYLVGERRVLVIDPGPDDPAHRRRIIDVLEGREVVGIAVTHTHPDHAPGARRLASVTQAPQLGFASGPGFDPDKRIADGELIGEPDSLLRVLHTPGHASDHCCYLLERVGLLFTGDHVMEGSTVVIRPPDGDVGAYVASLRRIIEHRPAIASLAPGHGRVIEDPEGAVREIIAHRQAREALVLSALAARGAASAQELLDAVYPGLEATRHDIATATLWGHLRHLGQQGELRPVGCALGDDSTDTVFCVDDPS